MYELILFHLTNKNFLANSEGWCFNTLYLKNSWICHIKINTQFKTLPSLFMQCSEKWGSCYLKAAVRSKSTRAAQFHKSAFSRRSLKTPKTADSELWNCCTETLPRCYVQRRLKNKLCPIAPLMEEHMETPLPSKITLLSSA